MACLPLRFGMAEMPPANSPKRGRVFLARDRLGIKPLYYAMVAGAIFFASELRALLASDAIERRLSLEALEGYLLFGSVVEPHHVIEGVYSLPPGHSLTLKLGCSDFSPEPSGVLGAFVRAIKFTTRRELWRRRRAKCERCSSNR